MNVWGADVENAIISSSTTDYTTVLSFTKDNSNATCEVATQSDTKCVKVAIGGTGNKSAYLTTTSSFTNIKSISLKIATSDKGKTSLAIEVSPNADFSENITTVQELALCNALPTAASSNNTFYLESYTLDPTISGYVRLRLCQPSSSGKFMYVADYTITTAAAGPVTPVCPDGLTIASKDAKTAFVEGDKIELSASLAAGNGEISYQWYKGDAAIGGASKNLTINSCVLDDAGSYTCKATKTDCEEAVSENTLVLTVKEYVAPCATMGPITSSVAVGAAPVSGVTLLDASVKGKTVEANSNGLKLGGNDSRLMLTLDNATIVEGTKIVVKYKNAASNSGVGVFNENYANQVINTTGISGAGSIEHTFTAAEAANYTNVFIITRNATGASNYINAVEVYNCGPAVATWNVTFDMQGATSAAIEAQSVKDGKKAVEPEDPEKTGFNFVKWVVASTEADYDFDAAVTADVALKAVWEEITTSYTVTYNAKWWYLCYSFGYLYWW